MLNEALNKARALQEGANKLISIGLLDGLYIRGLSTAMSNIENKIDVKIERVERARPQELNMNLVKEQNDVIITTWPMIENKIRFESEIITAEPLMLYCPTDISGDLSNKSILDNSKVCHSSHIIMKWIRRWQRIMTCSENSCWPSMASI